MVGMQNESSSLWRESEAIFQKPLSNFACHQGISLPDKNLPSLIAELRCCSEHHCLCL